MSKIDPRLKVGLIVEKHTYNKSRGKEKIVEIGKIDLGRPCFRLESGEAYRTTETVKKGFCNSGNAAFWCVIVDD